MFFLYAKNKCVFAFYTEILRATKNGRKTIFGKNRQMTRPVSEINAFLHFMQKFKMVTKNGGKTTTKSRLMTPYRNRFLAPFLRYLRFFIFIVKKIMAFS